MLSVERGQVMMKPELKSPIEEPLNPDSELAQEIADIVEQASISPENQASETETWYYRIPLAGVREYFFEH